MSQISKIIKNWDIPKVNEVTPVNTNSFRLFCDNGISYFLKEKRSVEQIEFEGEFLSYIKNNGIPVSVPLTTNGGKCYAEHNIKYYALYRFIQGHHLRCTTFEEYKEAAELYGKILGKLHRIFQSYDKKHRCIKQMDLSSQVFNWAIPVIEDQNVYPEIKKTMAELKGEMFDIVNSLPQQYIHRDFHEDNIMFDGKEFVGLIDFDTCMVGHKIYDICYIMTSILMNGVNDDVYKKNWLSLLPAFIDGYLKENELNDDERRGVWHVFIASQLTFIAYFIAHPNEKLLKENAKGFSFIYENRAAIEEIFKRKP